MVMPKILKIDAKKRRYKMSIEICNECTTHIDTDYDVETIVYQNEMAVCRDCAISQCYSYSVRDFDAAYSNAWRGGFIEAFTDDDAIDKLSEIYGPIKKEDLKVRHDGKWDSFLKAIKSNKFD